MNLANKLTVLRIILVPIMVIIAYIPLESSFLGISTNMWLMNLIFIIASITVFLITVGQRALQIEEISKRSKEYVETYLKKEDDVEVIPIDGKSYKEFMHRKGKFYARIISDDEVGIWFQYNDETEKKFLEK